MQNTIELILENYVHSSQNESFTQNPTQHLLTRALRKQIEETASINTQQYYVKGSAGQANWAAIPWAAVFDREITTTATKGFGIVYLFCKDMSGVYLSINQGYDFYYKKYRTAAALDKIKLIGSHLRNKLRSDSTNFPLEEIDLKISSNDDLGVGYEAENIIAKYYPGNSIPPNNVLVSDLRELMGIFSEMKAFIPKKDDDLSSWVEHISTIATTGIEEDDGEFQPTIQTETPQEFVDEPVERPSQSSSSSSSTYRRNPQKAANALWNADYKCEYDPTHKTFTSKSSGNSFVEAHHLIPMSEQTNYEKSLDVEANIVALCPNCHRKVHLATDEEAQEINNFLLNARHDRLVQVGLRSNGNN